MSKRDKDLEKYWRGTIHRQAMSGLGVKAFCDKENLKEYTFYYWQRELKARDEEEQSKKRSIARRKTRSEEPADAEDDNSQKRKSAVERRAQREEEYWLEILDEWADSRLSSQEFASQRDIDHGTLWRWMRKLRPNTRGNKIVFEDKKEPQVDFAPATIVEDTEDIKPRTEVTPAQSMVEIVLRCGRVIRLNSECTPSFLTAVIAAAEEAS